jgi:hypothetical protein
MYDFESVSVSSYEAGSLAATLTERSADGWDVVAIVPAGSDVVAYLRRATEADDDASAGTGAQITDGTSNTIALEAATSDSPADLLTPTSVSSQPAVSDTAAVDTDITSPTATPSTTSSSEDGGTGWGVSDDTAAGAAAPGAAASGASAGGWSSGAESTWSGSSQQAATPAATPAVPAGWYADPAGRFELRYWDGSAWTEHVSRQGQQYTDPPVA